MRGPRTLLALVSAVLLLAAGLAAQKTDSAQALLRAATDKAVVDGDLTAAIKQYQTIVDKFKTDRAVVATALVRMADCYQKLGRPDAQQAYERIVREYADQPEVVRQAQAKLNANGASTPATPTTRQVWTGLSGAFEGALSPDGRLLSNVDLDTGNLVVRDLKRGDIRRLTTEGSWEPLGLQYADESVFSPDSRQIAYGWFTKAREELRVVGIDGSKPSVVYRNDEIGWVNPRAWSANGQLLAILETDSGTNQIAFLSVATRAVRVLKTLDWRWPSGMSLSPDGAYITYDFPPKEDAPERDIYLLASDGSRETRLIEHAANDHNAIWTPDGTHVLFESDRSGTSAAWLLRVESGKPVGDAILVKPDMTRASLIGFAPQGALYYSLNTGESDLYVATLDSQTGKSVGPPARATQRFVGSNTAPDWSTDGRLLAYVSGRSGWSSRVICILDTKTGAVRELSPPLAYYGHLHWSPDGQSLILPAQNKLRWGVYRINASTGQVAQILQVDPTEAVFTAALSADGKALFYSRVPAANASWVVMRRDLDTDRDAEIYRSSGVAYDLEPSPDGRWLAFQEGRVMPERAGTLRLLPLDGGRTRDLLAESPYPGNYNGYKISWMPDGQHLLFAEGQGGKKFKLWRVSVEGGAPERVAPDLVLDGLTQARLHPDGTRLAFSAGHRGSDVWVMENFLPALKAKK